MSNTLSRLIKEKDAASAQPYDWGNKGMQAEDGVRAFRPRQVNESAEPEPEVVAEPETEPAEPPPPPVDLDAVRKEAFQHGFDEGVETGCQKAEESSRQELQTSVDALGNVAIELAAFKDALRHDVEREVVDLAFSIARRIIRRELTVDPSTTLGIIRSCVEEFSAAEIRRLEVNPADASLITPYFEGRPGPTVEIVANEAIQRGGALFDTAQGQLDARLEAQISEIESGLADRWTPSGSAG